MLFTSLEFIIFVTVLILVYYLFVPRTERWGLLLIASLAFYFFADPRYLIYIAFTALTAYVFAILSEDYQVKRKTYLKANKEYTFNKLFILDFISSNLILYSGKTTVLFSILLFLGEYK